MTKLKPWIDYVIGGVIGAALVTFLFNWVEERHKTAVTRVSDQISKLYQPFYSASLENDMAWCVFVEGTWRATSTDRPRCDDPTKGYWEHQIMPDPDVIRWRSRMKSIFQPLNKHMLEIIDANSALLIKGEEPPLWQVFTKHTLGYQGLIGEWREDDQQQRHSDFINIRYNVVSLPYPNGLTVCSQKLLDLLRAEIDRIEKNPFIWSESDIGMPDECQAPAQDLALPPGQPRH